MNKRHCDNSGCPVACALDILGDRWTLLIVRDLMFFGKHEFKDFLAGEEGISTNILSERLKRLSDYGLVDVIPHPEVGTRKLYFLTRSGKDLVHTLTHLVRWSAEHLKDEVRIPAERLQLLQGGAQPMIDHTLAELARWETENGVTSQ